MFVGLIVCFCVDLFVFKLFKRFPTIFSGIFNKRFTFKILIHNIVVDL